MNYLADRQGNVAMMFAILVIPLILGVGVAIDTLRSNQVKTELAEAADAGVLAAASARLQNPTLTREQAEMLANRAFNANRKSRSDFSLSTFDFQFDEITGTFSLRVTGLLDTAIMSVVGQNETPIDIFTEAKIAPPNILEAVLVLDNTESMAGAKLDNLKSSANNLIDIIMKDVRNETKVGIVPFSNHVNVGLSRRAAAWLDVPDDFTELDVCMDTFPNPDPATCSTVTTTCFSDGIPNSCDRMVCTDMGAPVEVCEDVFRQWHGCVGSRNAPLNVEDRDYTGLTRVPGLLDVQCQQELLPLTKSKSDVRAKIDSMTANGPTFIAAGLTWGYRLISNNEPFTEGVTYDEIRSNGGLKTIIVMTDGANTRAAAIPGSPRHNVRDSIASDATLIAVCDEVKNDEIVLYTIAFDVSDSNIKDRLETCATTVDHYFDASNARQLEAAFQTIANQLSELALSR